jgi:hypothetical protein
LASDCVVSHAVSLADVQKRRPMIYRWQQQGALDRCASCETMPLANRTVALIAWMLVVIAAVISNGQMIRLNDHDRHDQLKARFTDLGAEPMSMTPAEFEKFVVDETEKWGKVVKAAGIRVD